MSDVTRIKPYGATGSKTEQVRHMFDRIAPAYDTMNRLMSLGLDRRWRRRAIDEVARYPHREVLDVGCGTGDFALGLARHLPDVECVRGIDLSAEMVAKARAKAGQWASRVRFDTGDCLDLPLDDNSVDAVTAAFVVRNFENLERGLAQMCRVARPGGPVCVLELSTPTNRVARWGYDLYTRHLIPAVGGLLSGDRDAYAYLPASIAAVPQGQAMLELMRRAGLVNAQAHTMTLGVCSLYIAFKPKHS